MKILWLLFRKCFIGSCCAKLFRNHLKKKSFKVSNFHTSTSRIQVRLGEHNIAVNEGTEQWIDGAKMIKHPQYNSYNLDNDIMLIKLSRPATLNSYVQTVSLPSRCPVADENCMVSGWGNMSANGSKLSLRAEAYRRGVKRGYKCGLKWWWRMIHTAQR